MIEITMIYAAMRVLVEDFGSPGAISWAITGFLLVSAISAVLFGRLGDMFNRKRLLLWVIVISIVGSLISGFSSTITGVVVGRCVQGVAGGIFPLCIGVLRENIDIRKLPIFIGFLSGVMSVTGGVGLYLGGMIIDHLSWHWIFFTTASIGVIAWIVVYIAIPDNAGKDPEPGTNYLGGLLFAPSVAFLLIAFTKVRDWGFASPSVVTLLMLSMVLAVLWVRSELKAEKPLLNVRLLLDREILLVVLATGFFGLSWMQFGQTWSLFLQQSVDTGAGLGLSASAAGLVMQPQSLMSLIAGPVAGWFLIRYGTRASILLGSFGLGAAWVAAILKNDAVWFILLLMIVMGFTSSFLVTVKVSIMARAAPAHQTGEAIGMLTLVRSIFNSIGALVVFFLLSSTTVTGPDGRGQFPSAAAYDITMSYIAVGTLLIGVVYLVFHRSSRRVASLESSRSESAT
ncbi:MAG: MFS transporter [Bacteroidales bacterium]|nr:MFS transporter [Bacteroidales bacterium]